MYERGDNVPLGYKKALDLYEKSASQGIEKAITSLNNLRNKLCLDGIDQNTQLDYGVDAYNRSDYEKAVSLWMPLAVQGNSREQYNIASMYEDGIGGLQKDLLQTAQWLRRAADNGESEAMNKLGKMYKEG